MREEISLKLEEVKNHLGELDRLGKAIGLLYWDMQTYMPKKAIESRSAVIGDLSTEQFRKSTSDKVLEFINFFSDKMDELDFASKRMIEEMKKDYEQTKKIPEDRYREYVMLSAKSEHYWEEAKEKSDFSIFEPYLEKIVEFQKEFIEYWGYKDNKYDTLLDLYEPGITVEKLDKIFGDLKNEIVTLLNKINSSNTNVDRSILTGEFNEEKQKELSLYVLDLMKFDMDAGRLDVSVHPFTTNFGNKDVRLTTNYVKEEFTYALYSTIHEGGHGLYEQNISDDLENTSLDGGVSMGIHESQSRFYENIIGRGEDFCKYILPKAKEIFPQFKDISEEDFYKAINKVEPSLIRTEADELTYSIHIIIRYEIEKELINGNIKVSDLTKIWNEKYNEYLGITPSCDREGVLQDVHWAGGSFGYFPSYALGNLYGAQMLNTLLKENPTAFEDVRKGNLENIKAWLVKNVHQYGKLYSPGELIKRITGEELDAKYFVNYLNEKYSKIYSLD